MSRAAELLVRAVVAQLQSVPELAQVTDGAARHPGDPVCEVAVESERDWSHKSGAGRELRLGVTIRSAGEPDKLRRLSEAVAAAVEGLRIAGGAWQLVTLTYLGSRARRDTALIEFRARLLRVTQVATP